MKLRVIGGDLVRELLTMHDCISSTRTAMMLTASGHAVQPIRSVMRVPQQKNLLGMMPGYIEDPRWLGIKVTAVFPENFKLGLSSHQGMICMFEPDSGKPFALVAGSAVTAIRTAAASAVATDALARKDAQTLGIFGYGEQAGTHLESIPLVRNVSNVFVWGRSFESATAFAQTQAVARGLSVSAARSCEEVARSCDILCTLTAADEPFLRGEWLREGVHLNVVGSSIPTTSEIDVEAVRKSRYFTDYTESARALSGDFKRARESGAVEDSHLLGCVGDVLSGKIQGRRSANDVTLFKSLGMASEDLMAAHVVVQRAIERDLGSLVNF